MAFPPCSWESWSGALIRIYPPWVDIFVDSPQWLPVHNRTSFFEVTAHWYMCLPLSALELIHTAVSLVPGSLTQLCSRARLRSRAPSALICFPNLSLTGISAVTQKAASRMDHLSVFISTTLFLCVLSLSLHLSASVSLSLCNPLLWWVAYGANVISLAECCCGRASKLSARILNAPCLCFTHLHSQPSPQLTLLSAPL